MNGYTSLSFLFFLSFFLFLFWPEGRGVTYSTIVPFGLTATRFSMLAHPRGNYREVLSPLLCVGVNWFSLHSGVDI